MKNTYKVPIKKWSKWSNQAKFVFNEVFCACTAKSRTLWPNSLKGTNRNAIKCMAWNTAWIAADAAQEAIFATGSLDGLEKHYI